MIIAAQSVSVLNASYEALGSTKMSRALSLVLENKAEIVEALEHTISSVSGVVVQIPKVIRLLKYVAVPFVHAPEFWSKSGVIRRDSGKCGYCLTTRGQMTVDHIIPKSRHTGNPDTWENTVACCLSCNRKKADYMLEEIGMKLMIEPYTPYRIYLKSNKKHKRK